MAKTTVTSIITKAKRRIDYDIDDDDLQELLLDMTNDALKQIAQWLFDAGKMVDLGQTTELKTTALQAYIDISTDLANADDIYKISERINDVSIEIIPYWKFIQNWTDPTASSSNVPIQCAIWNNRLYLGPTPTDTDTSIFAEWIGLPVDVVIASTLPYKTKYDPLIIALIRSEFRQYQDEGNAVAIAAAQSKVTDLKDLLIVKASSNVGMNRQSQSRDEGGMGGPGESEVSPVYGFGVGGAGLGGFGE